MGFPTLSKLRVGLRTSGWLSDLSWTFRWAFQLLPDLQVGLPTPPVPSGLDFPTPPGPLGGPPDPIEPPGWTPDPLPELWMGLPTPPGSSGGPSDPYQTYEWASEHLDWPSEPSRTFGWAS